MASVDSTLALHAATPAVQAFYNFYQEKHGDKGGACLENGKNARGQAWVDWYGRVACTAQDLNELMDEKASGDGYVPCYSLSFIVELTGSAAIIHVQNFWHSTISTHRPPGPLFGQAGPLSCTHLWMGTHGI